MVFAVFDETRPEKVNLHYEILKIRSKNAISSIRRIVFISMFPDVPGLSALISLQDKRLDYQKFKHPDVSQFCSCIEMTLP